MAAASATELVWDLVEFCGFFPRSDDFHWKSALENLHFIGKSHQFHWKIYI
jgi:hypothetical protein